MGTVAKKVEVECYAGYRGDETPRTLVLDGSRIEVAGVLARRRAIDRENGRVSEVWRCRLADGRTVDVGRDEAGAWRVSAAV